MCEYSIYSKEGFLMCEPKNEPCTMCIIGNHKNYKEIESMRGERAIVKNDSEKKMYRVHLELGTESEIDEFTNICKSIPEEVMVRGKDENGRDWYLSAKSLFCSLIMSTKLQKHREHNAHEVDWNTIYVECERDIYPLVSKFAK